MFERAKVTSMLGSGLRLGLALGLALAAAGCDSKATASDPAAVAPARKSKELESCAATHQCADGLRCLDQLCQREARSAVGDFLAARGARALAAGDAAGALRSYNEASAAYEAEQLAVPPDLDCAWGKALVAGRAEKDKAELAARILHRCLLAAPPGGRLRAEALAALTDLDRSGFDPRQLARRELADLYLTAAPAKPDASKLTVSVSPEPTPRGRNWPPLATRLGQDDVKAALLGCWEAAYDARQAKAVSARVTLAVKYLPSQYDDEPGRHSIAVEPAGGDDAECVKTALATALTDVKGLRGEGLTTTLNVSVK